MQDTAIAEAHSRVGALQPFKPGNAPLATTGPPTTLAREVFGFGLLSSLGDPTIGYPSWNFNDLSTVAVFGLHVNWDGTFVNDSSYQQWNSSSVSGLVTTAHAHGTKVVLTIILQDFASGTPTMCDGLTGSNAATTVRNTVAEVNGKGVDGVNVDYEGLNGSCGHSDSSWARHAFTAFVQSLRSALGSGPYLSVCTYASSAGDPQGFFDIPGLAPYSDSFFVMAYDSDYSNYGSPPIASCASYCLNPVSPLSGYYYNDTRAATEYSNAVPASKVILGLPYYSRGACVSSWAANQYPVNQHTWTLDYRSNVSMASDPTNANYALHRDGYDGVTAWSTWTSTNTSCRPMEMYWDDVYSLGQKYDLVNSARLRGVGLWNLNLGGGAPELWASLAEHFGGWSASYDMSHAPTSWAVGQSQTFPVTVTNTGTQTWPSTGTDEVDLELHFAVSPGGHLNQSGWTTNQAFSIPADLPPGGSATVSVTVTAPATGGSTVLEAEMIKEHEFWFEEYSPVNIGLSLWSAAYDMSRAPTSWVAGEAQTFPVTLTNTSQQTWPATGTDEVDLDLHFASSAGGSANQGSWLSSVAVPLSANVPPGGTTTVNVTVAPPGYGHLVLEAELIKEHEFWFVQYAPVNVLVAAPVWSASYDLSHAPANWAANQAQTFPVTVTNTGNTSWPSTGYTEVDLDLHFASSAGGSANQSSWLDSYAFSLPANVPPGGSATVNVTLTPPGFGHLVLEAEMVKEHQFWFAQYAPVNVYVAPPVWSASYDVSHVPANWVNGQSQTFTVTVTNTGNQAWPSGGYTAAELDLHFASYPGGAAAQQYWLSSQAFALAADLAPGQSATVTVTMSPPGFGHLVLEAEMVKEHQFWFDQYAPVNVYVSPH